MGRRVIDREVWLGRERSVVLGVFGGFLPGLWFPVGPGCFGGIGQGGAYAAVEDGDVELSAEADLFGVVFGGDHAPDTLVEVVYLFEFGVADEDDDEIVEFLPVPVHFFDNAIDLGRDGEVGTELDADGAAESDVGEPRSPRVVRPDAPAGSGERVFEFGPEMGYQVAAVLRFARTFRIGRPFGNEGTGVGQEVFRHCYHHGRLVLVENLC